MLKVLAILFGGIGSKSIGNTFGNTSRRVLIITELSKESDSNTSSLAEERPHTIPIESGKVTFSSF